LGRQHGSSRASCSGCGRADETSAPNFPCFNKATAKSIAGTAQRTAQRVAGRLLASWCRRVSAGHLRELLIQPNTVWAQAKNATGLTTAVTGWGFAAGEAQGDRAGPSRRCVP